MGARQSIISIHDISVDFLLRILKISLEQLENSILSYKGGKKILCTFRHERVRKIVFMHELAKSAKTSAFYLLNQKLPTYYCIFDHHRYIFFLEYKFLLNEKMYNITEIFFAYLPFSCTPLYYL